MEAIRMVNRHNHKDREDETMLFKNKEQAMDTFNDWVWEHLESYGLSPSDVELDEREMYDKDHWIEIYVVEKALH